MNTSHSNRSDGLLSSVLGWARNRRGILAGVVLVLFALPFIPVLNRPAQGDINLYHRVAVDIGDGVMPYRDRVLEYPPYAIAYFVLPHLMNEITDYNTAFKLCSGVLDGALKCLLLLIGLKQASGLRSLLPLVSYCAVVPFLREFYLQRYDLLPAILTLSALWCIHERRYTVAGVLISAGAGVKLYPALLMPVLFILSWRACRGKKFMLGLALGALPLVLLGGVVPWWKFLQYHGERGLQVESLYASILWFSHHLGLTEIFWTFGYGAWEVTGPLTAHLLVWAKCFFAFTVLAAVGLACAYAARVKVSSVSQLAQLVLLPLTAFLAFNQVLSPQYLIWLLPIASIAILDDEPMYGLALLGATTLTPLFYPSPFYESGLRILETAVLLLRNVTLVTVCLFLAHTLWRKTKTASEYAS